MSRRLYRIEVRYVGFAWCESEDAADDCCDAMLDRQEGFTKVRLVRDKGDHPPRGWGDERLVYTDGLEEVAFGDVWPR